jgi:pimeloyl-ACP methyl ester carboxylesterase
MPHQAPQPLGPSTAGTDPALDTLCRNFLYRFYELYDQADYDALVGLFTPEGSWYRANELLQGPEQMLAALQQRPGQRRSLHAVNNLQVLPSSATHIELRFWLTVFRSDEPAARDQPVSIASPAMLLSGRADVVMQAGQPRFAHQSLQREFLFTPA